MRQAWDEKTAIERHAAMTWPFSPGQQEYKKKQQRYFVDTYLPVSEKDLAARKTAMLCRLDYFITVQASVVLVHHQGSDENEHACSTNQYACEINPTFRHCNLLNQVELISTLFNSQSPGNQATPINDSDP
jgi:hypothetical protein